MHLIINTTKDNEISVILAKTAKDFKVYKKSGERKQSEHLLRLVEAAMKKNKIELKKIKGLGVVTGPGGFTSVRIGVASANTLAYALKIPVVGLSLKEFSDNNELVVKVIKKLKAQKKFKPVVPVYDREPNIG